jgi:hypothetical protein
MPALRRAVFDYLTVAETTDQRLDQRLLKTPRCFGLGDDLGSVLRKLHGRRMQPLKPCHRRW